MEANVVQAGQLVQFYCRPRWVANLVEEACGQALTPGSRDRKPDVYVVVTGERSAFDLRGWTPLTRDAFQRDRSVVMTNVCGSGFDICVTVLGDEHRPRVRLEARFRPPVREHVAAWGLRSRFHLLARAVLSQYPALWVAGTRGWAPLHASGVRVGDESVLVAGPGGVGRSSLLISSLEDGAQACTDNVCVSDGTQVAGVVEPMRVTGAAGRRMPHGRAEQPLPNRVSWVVPTCVVVVRRGLQEQPVVRPISAEKAAEVLVAGTYMAGELRRYWSFAATLALGSGLPAVHPRIQDVADTLSRLPAVELSLGRPPAPSLATVLRDARSVRA